MIGNKCGNMKIIIMLASIVLVSATQVNPPPRSVNVALETSFLFDPKDVNDNKSFVNNIRGFLDKLYRILEPQTADKQFRSETQEQSPIDKRLDDFLKVMQKLGSAFMKMTAKDLKEALDIMHDGIKNVTDKQTPLAVQLMRPRAPDIIQEMLDALVHRKPEEIKIFLNASVYENKKHLEKFARRMNGYYDDHDVKKINKILKKFKRHIDNKQDTSKIIKQLLHSTIFKKYENLNDSAKAAVMDDLKMLSEFFFAKNGATGHVKNRVLPPSHEADKAEVPDITYAALRRSIDEKIRNAREKNEDNKKANNEVVVDNVELFVEPPPST